MPTDDLLRFISGPPSFSGWWLVLGILLIVAVFGWAASIYVWTLPPSRLRGIPVLRGLHSRLLRRRFVRAVRGVGSQFRAGGLTPPEAASRLSRVLRSFLFAATGTRAQYLHIDDIVDTPPVAVAAPLLSALNDAQYNRQSHVDLPALERAAEELISAWS